MSSKTFARLMLFFPHLMLGALWLISTEWASRIAIFAFIPYTILAVGLLIWSRNKTVDKMEKVFIFHSPILLVIVVAVMYLILITVVIVLADLKITDNANPAIILIPAAIVSVPVSPFIGYICAGFSLLTYQELKERKFIRD
jgi:hypothetical protein